MLKKLDIRNFTLIDHLEMLFYPGFSVITGETGAGKSIIIGAIGLLLGNRADTKMVKRGAYSYHFFDEHDQHILYHMYL